MKVEDRAGAHAALGDAKRLVIVDALAVGDLTVAELAELTGMPGNLLAHHLDVLAAAGLVSRQVSEGDRRRRYVSLRWERLPISPRVPATTLRSVAFVCTHNSARSPFAAAMGAERLGVRTASAGSQPATRVHPLAVEVAAEFGIDLAGSQPGGYERIATAPDLVVTVCDRAREAGFPGGRRTIHWSIPDPVPAATKTSFRTAFTEIARRIERLTAAA